MTENKITATEQTSGSTGYLVMVCLVAAIGGLLFGYDTAVVSGAIGFLQTKFHLDPMWVGWSASTCAGRLCPWCGIGWHR